MCCTIINPKPGVDVISANEGNGMALKNIRRRLHAYYGDKAALVIDETESQYSVILNYPHIQSLSMT